MLGAGPRRDPRSRLSPRSRARWPREAAARRGAREHARLPAIRADPSACPSSTRSSPTAASGSMPDALALLQEIREQHARAAGLVALSGATDAPLEVAGLGGELKPFQRAGVSYLLAQPARVPRRRAGSRQDDRGAGDARGGRRIPGDRGLPGEPQAQLAARARALAAAAQRACALGSAAPAPPAAAPPAMPRPTSPSSTTTSSPRAWMS